MEVDNEMDVNVDDAEEVDNEEDLQLLERLQLGIVSDDMTLILLWSTSLSLWRCVIVMTRLMILIFRIVMNISKTCKVRSN
jgi:hypothetical protein